MDGDSRRQPPPEFSDRAQQLDDRVSCASIVRGLKLLVVPAGGRRCGKVCWGAPAASQQAPRHTRRTPAAPENPLRNRPGPDWRPRNRVVGKGCCLGRAALSWGSVLMPASRPPIPVRPAKKRRRATAPQRCPVPREASRPSAASLDLSLRRSNRCQLRCHPGNDSQGTEGQQPFAHSDQRMDTQHHRDDGGHGEPAVGNHQLG